MYKIWKRVAINLTVAVLLAALPAAGAVAVASGDSVLRAQTKSYRSGPLELRYVALGDSVAAGLGLAPSAAPTNEDRLCGRSPLAYANTVASEINAKLSGFNLRLSLTNAACQGATIDNLANPQSRNGSTIQAQLDTAFTQGTPALISLTMGANDTHWADFIGACLGATNCDTPANTALANSYAAAMQTELASALNEIRSRSQYVPPIVVVTGYYIPVSLQCVNPIFQRTKLPGSLAQQAY